jgi:hypothetical protein
MNYRCMFVKNVSKPFVWIVKFLFMNPYIHVPDVQQIQKLCLNLQTIVKIRYSYVNLS